MYGSLLIPVITDEFNFDCQPENEINESMNRWRRSKKSWKRSRKVNSWDTTTSWNWWAKVQFCVYKAGVGLNLYLNTYAVSGIWSPLSHHCNLELADSSSCDAEMPIDILISMTGKTWITRNWGPVALKTQLGCVLSGPVHKRKSDVNWFLCLLEQHHCVWTLNQ